MLPFPLKSGTDTTSVCREKVPYTQLETTAALIQIKHIAAMPGADTPLLDRQHPTDASEDLERGLHSGADNDFKHLIDSYPEAVIKYDTSAYSVLIPRVFAAVSVYRTGFPMHAHVQSSHAGYIGSWKRKAWRSWEVSTFQ